MYKLLLATDQGGIRDMLKNRVSWVALNCTGPAFAATAQEAIGLLRARAVDAVGCAFADAEEARKLEAFLNAERPCVPVFDLSADEREQLTVLHEARTMLNRLKADFADEYYDEASMLTMHQDELVRSLLTGKVEDFAALKRCLRLLRLRLDAEKTCILYELDLPQGNAYTTAHQHAQVRLESAIRNNFCGRRDAGVYYAVAMLSPRHIRLVCVPTKDGEALKRDAFAAQTDRHVQDTVMMMKEYLDLDVTIQRTAWLEQGLKELVTE